MNRDFVEMLSALIAARADFIVVGAYALAAHGIPRATDADNAVRILSALSDFGAPLLDLTMEDLTRPDTVFQIGVAPSRVSILTSVTALDFVSARRRSLSVVIEGKTVAVLSREDFVTNKRALARPKGLADLALLDEASSER